MSDSEIKLITPSERLDLVPFDATETSDGVGLSNIRLEDYGQLPFVELDMPPMDHHVLIFNYNPPTTPIYHGCGGKHHNDRWHRDQVAIIPAFYDNQWLIPETNSSGLHILFPHSEVSRLVEESFDIDPANLEFDSTFQTDDPVLRNLSQLIHQELKSGFAMGHLYIESLATAATLQFINNFSNREVRALVHNGKISPAGLKKLVRYIDDRIGTRLTLDELAAQVHMSSFNFARAFKQSTGYSPHQYVLSRRTYYACQLLRRDKKLTLAQVADIAGFTDQSHMNKLLKRAFGLSGSQIRKDS